MSADLEPTSAAPSGNALVKVTLVPVEHFGADEEYCGQCGAVVDTGYGVMDAVSAWSDCNRAIGRIYRVDDTEPRYRQPGDTITVYVPQSELAKFEKRFGDDAGHRCPGCHVPYGELPEGHRVNRPTCSSPLHRQRLRQDLRHSPAQELSGGLPH